MNRIVIFDKFNDLKKIAALMFLALMSSSTTFAQDAKTVVLLNNVNIFNGKDNKIVKKTIPNTHSNVRLTTGYRSVFANKSR